MLANRERAAEIRGGLVEAACVADPADGAIFDVAANLLAHSERALQVLRGGPTAGARRDRSGEPARPGAAAEPRPPLTGHARMVKLGDARARPARHVAARTREARPRPRLDAPRALRDRLLTAAAGTATRDLRAELIAKVNSGERVALSRQTLSEYGDEWLEGQRARLRPSTHARYSISLEKHVYPRVGRERLADVTVNDVARLIGELEKGIRSSTTTKPRQRDRQLFAARTIRGVSSRSAALQLGPSGRARDDANREGKLQKRGERPKVSVRSSWSRTSTTAGPSRACLQDRNADRDEHPYRPRRG